MISRKSNGADLANGPVAVEGYRRRISFFVSTNVLAMIL
jgi:hypothetical protein